MTSTQVQDGKYSNCTAALYRGNCEPRPVAGDQGQWILHAQSNSLPVITVGYVSRRDARIITNSNFTNFLKNCAFLLFFYFILFFFYKQVAFAPLQIRIIWSFKK
jgi:hypothetical protein